MLDRIKELCFNEDKTKLIQKRNLNWLKIHHDEFYHELINAFPDTSLSHIKTYLMNGILSNNDIPFCETCNVNKVHVREQRILKYCSNKCAIKSSSTQEKTKKTCSEKYGKSRKWGKQEKYEFGQHYLQKNIKNINNIENESIMKKLQDSGSWELVADHFGLSTNSHSSAFKFMIKNGYPIRRTNGSSKAENEIIEFVKSLGFDVEINQRNIIKPYEIDIYIPEKKLAIEFNGLYWHSSNNIEDDKFKSKYHLIKTELCEELEISLLHIFENEWKYLKDIWKSVIAHKLGKSLKIHARKCVIKDIDKKVAKEFCIKNHLQGSANCSFAKGLYFNDELVMVATFGKSRYSNKIDLELIRMCTKLNLCIVGGASKITKGHSFVSYGNRRWCSQLSNVYSNFCEYTGVSDPCYWYIKNYNLYHRSTYMKHKLKNIFENFDDNLTEVENCYNNGLRRIWDSGNLVFIKK